MNKEEQTQEQHKSITFLAQVDNFKTKGGAVTVQLAADSVDIDKNLLAEIMELPGGTTVKIIANQTELVKEDKDEEADGQTELPVGDDE